MEDEIKLSLDKDEALVLFEFLWRFSEVDILKIEDLSEEKVLWNLCCDLEKKLVECFQKNYDEIVSNARKNVRDKNE